MDLISKSLHYIGKRYSNIFVVQIGAMDGIAFDDTRGFLDMYKWPALLVEPIPEIYDKLKYNFKDRNNYLYENSAIAEEDGERDMLTVPHNIIESEQLHPGYLGMSALYPLKNGFGSEYERDILVKNNFGRNVKVKCLTFQSLLDKHNISNFDILICDAEGYDWQIFKQLDFSKYSPKFIRLEYINLNEEEKFLTKKKLEENDYVVSVSQNIDAVKKEIWEEINVDSKTTIVTGLWNIGRNNRDFSHYEEHFNKFLDINSNLFIYVPSELEHLIWKKRNRSNTFVKVYELSDVKHLYQPFWDKTQKIRTSQSWLNKTGEEGWLKNSPQATSEWYNPIVQSKMFMLNDASIWNPFDSEYFFWLDAGITNTVYEKYFTEHRVLDKLPKYAEQFLFLSYPYDSSGEIHGFDFEAMNRYAGTKVEYVCRGGLFGGRKEVIHEANATYYAMLDRTLSDGYMGTEESVFTIMSYMEPWKYRRYALDSNGLIVKFAQALDQNSVTLEPVVESKTAKKNKVVNTSKIKVSLYMLTFNFPHQVEHTIQKWLKHPNWISNTRNILIDNSTNEEARIANAEICNKYNFEHIITNENTGINGGRFRAAQHFQESDSDYYVFLEDDMGIHSPESQNQFCRNGFRTYVPNLYDKAIKIMERSDVDFLKLSYTEVYMDNNIQVSWYNVPQSVRTEVWPDYDKLPVTGLDPNCPRTQFKNIEVLEDLSYATGEIYYCNWPTIMGKNGNQKVFLDTTWARPYEQTWMSYVFQETRKGSIKPAVLLASPIDHERIAHYKPEDRREN